VKRGAVLFPILLLVSGCDVPGTSQYAAHNSIRALLKDPDSAMFQDDRVITGGTVCGEVNAKNSLGGYIGFRPYIFSDGQSMIDQGEPDFSALVRSVDMALQDEAYFHQQFAAAFSECDFIKTYKKICGIPHPADSPQMAKRCQWVEDGDRGIKALKDDLARF